MPYYYNTQTLVTQWEVPDDFVDYSVSADNLADVAQDPTNYSMNNAQIHKQIVQNQASSYSVPAYTAKGTFNMRSGRWEGPGKIQSNK